jgi:hypothetical protein
MEMRRHALGQECIHGKDGNPQRDARNTQNEKLRTGRQLRIDELRQDGHIDQECFRIAEFVMNPLMVAWREWAMDGDRPGAILKAFPLPLMVCTPIHTR